jgi:5-formyltetrahydrofolate cyclo-ligase
MWGAATEEKRDALRAAALSRRNSLSKANFLLWSRLIQAKALELPRYLTSRTVALYSPVQNEVATDEILQQALRARRKVFYPKIGPENAVEFVQIFSAADLAAGRFGTLEPTGLSRLSEGDSEDLVVFVPGVVFDLSGNRLGRGKGWYDRMLSRLGNKGVFVGLAYEFQIVDRVPTEAWDQKVRYLVTEERVIDCGITSS